MYVGEEISYLLSMFQTKEEAESWKQFLAYNTQEYKEKEMEVIKDNDNSN